MKKFFFLLWLIGFGLHLDGGLLEAKVYIDIRSPSFRKFPIGIRTFEDPLAPPTEMRMGSRATEILRSDLDISGFFSLVEGPSGKGNSGAAGPLRIPALK